MSGGIQEMVGRHLAEQGLESVPPEEVNKTAKPEMDESKARALGKALKARFVIYGSLTKVGDRFSMDARIVDVTGSNPTLSLFYQEAGDQGIDVMAQNLAAETGLNVTGQAKIAEIIN